MSYNNRRTGARLGPQVNYHQTQNTQQRPGNRPLNQQNPGYSTTTTSSYNQTSFSSQGGYSSVQSGKQSQQSQQQQQPQPQPQQQPQPQPQQQQQQPPPPLPPANAGTAASNATQAPPPPSQQQQQQNQSTPSPAVPSKGESLMPQSNDPVPVNEDKPETNGENRKKPFWKNKGPAYKVSRRIKRRRQNARLRKMLTPKNALMILNELHPGMKFIVQEQMNAINQTVYLVTVDIDGKSFHGQAITKIGAKQIACENALKSLLLEKMGRAVQEASEQMDHSQTESGTEDVKSESENIDDAMDGSSVSNNRSKRQFPEDDIPWGSLASFALHKLFLEWQNQGIQVPVVPVRSSTLMSRPVSRSSTVISQPSAESLVQTSGSPMPMKKIPEDANKRNPVQLLNQLKPGCQYSEQSNGIPPNLTFAMSVVIDGEEFVGIAGNKKDAKKVCAKAALTKMGIVYSD